MKSFKHLKQLLLIAFSVTISHFDANAHDFEVDGIYYNKSGNNATVTYKDSYISSYSGGIIIPEKVTYNGTSYSVTSIGEKAFYWCSKLTSVTIPNSVTSIGNYAFYLCSSLTSITIPNSVTSIGSSAFSDCSGLTEVTIPNSVTSIGGGAFYGCSKLTEFNGKFASEDHRCLIVEGILNSFAPAGLTEYAIPNSVTSIGNYAFYWCNKLTSVTIPNSVTSIGSYAFYYCSGLTEVTIGNSVTSIGEYAFSYCSGLTSFNGKLSSEDHRCLIVNGELTAFAPAGLTEYAIPNSVTSIGNYAFYRCSSLTSITIPNSVTSIGSSAFSDCSGLTEVTIPNSVTSIGRGAFHSCSSLNSFNGKFSSEDHRCLIVDSVLNSFAPAGLTEYAIPNSVTSIEYRAFFRCIELTSVTIPNSVTSIGNEAFYCCDNLTEVTIGNSVTSIGDWAFYYCENLIEVTIPNSVTSIGDYAFAYCDDLTSITVENPDPANIELGDDVFYDVPVNTCTLYVPEGSKELYRNAPQWSDFENIEELEGLSVDQVEMNAIQSITVVDGGLLINVEKESVITVADIAGRVRLYNVYPGENRINLESGIYVVNNNKIMIK